MPALRPARPLRQFFLCAFGIALVLFALCAPTTVLRAMQLQPATDQTQPAPFADSTSLLLPSEFEMLFVRLPLAAVRGTALALRPRRRGQGTRKVVVIQTQISSPSWAP